jgi:hypothetical protein
MLAQSVSGLAAQAVNEGRGDELVYIDLWDNLSYQRWRLRLLDRAGIEDRGDARVWDLVSKYYQQGIVAGYILYSDQQTKDQVNNSANVATTLAGILRGVLVTERQEATAQQLGLPMLLDVRKKTEAWCFDNYRDQLNRKQLLLQKSSIPNNRAIAIAHRVLTIQGHRQLAERVYEWLEAPALIHGWNSTQDEGASVRQSSAWGHVFCPSDWAMNLPALSMGADNLNLPRFPSSSKKPSTAADPAGAGQSVTFVLTDGDNLQWVLGDFAWNQRFWASPRLAETPFGFGLPMADLMEVAPDVYLFLQDSKPDSTSIIVAPQYVFVDHLGANLSARERRELLRWYGSRIESVLQRSGLRSIILICDRLDDAKTQAAWEILATAAPSLSVALVMQYDAYESGEGRIWQVERSDGPSVPFVSAAYSLWADLNRPRAGSPTEVARMINGAARLLQERRHPQQPRWVAVHAWSQFPADGVEVGDKEAAETYAGVGAASLCARQLSADSLVGSIDELSAALAVSSDTDTPAQQDSTAPAHSAESTTHGSRSP